MKSITNLKESGPKNLIPLIKAVKGERGILSPLMERILEKELSTLPNDNSLQPWEVLFPEGLLELNDKTVRDIRTRREITISKLNPTPICDLAEEFLITSNVLLDLPIDCSKVINKELSSKLQKIKDEAKQQYFYDHPIPMDTPLENNEIIYGLKNLNETVSYEKDTGVFPKEKKLTCLLSITTTYDELAHLTKEYLQETFQQTNSLDHLEIYAFSEADTKELVDKVLKPICKNNENFDFFGVSGEYGRHYSFLKSITAIIQATTKPKLKGSFKIDLDQVFDQDKLLKETNRSALSHFKSPLWGATGVDKDGRERKLGMIAGTLVNQPDAEKSLFTPDVTIPTDFGVDDTEFFCSQIPQAISTVAEMMPNKDEDFGENQTIARTRIHVTGGTNGILIDDLKRYRPFTPSFIGRAEDQAYLLSIFKEGYFPLTYLHKPGLVMRHDKEGFAGQAIQKAKLGRAIGDYQRILLFSAYGKLLDPTLEVIKDKLYPFTGCFISKYPLLLALLRLITKVQATKDKEEARELTEMGLERIEQTLDFVTHKLQDTIETERRGYDHFFKCVEAINQDSHYKQIATSIINNCHLN